MLGWRRNATILSLYAGERERERKKVKRGLENLDRDLEDTGEPGENLGGGYAPTGTTSWHCPLLAEVKVLEGRGRTGGPAWRGSSLGCEVKGQSVGSE